MTSRLKLLALVLAAGCKPAAESGLREVPGVEAAQGFMRPMMPSEFYVPRPKAEKIALNELAYVLQLDPYEVEEKGARVVEAPNGETVLVTDPAGNLPAPAYSVPRPEGGAKKKVLQWSEIAYINAGELTKSGLFVRHALDETPDYKRENIYIVRFPRSAAGKPEPVLVPWTRHFRGDDGLVFYRVGNSIVSADTQEPVVQLQVIGHYVWRVWGVYSDASVCSGTVFWAGMNGQGEPDGSYWSYGKGKTFATRWQTSGEFMTVAEQVPAAAVAVPAIVTRNLTECEAFGADNPPKPPGVDTNLLDQAVLPLFDGEWSAAASYVALRAKKPSGTLTPADARYEFADDMEGDGRGSTLQLAGAKPFKKGSKYKAGSLIQVDDGTIHKVIRTIEHDGWFGAYYSYDTVNQSSDRHGQLGRIAYKLDYRGRIVGKQHIRTLASEMAKDIKRADVQRATDMRVVAEQMADDRHQLEFAEKAAAQVDSLKKVAALTVANYAFDQVGRKFGTQVFNKNLALSTRLRNAGAMVATTVGVTGVLDWANAPNRATSERTQMLALTALTSGTAWSVYAGGNGLARVSFIAGVGIESATIIQQKALGYDVPDWYTTGARLTVNGVSAASQTALISAAHKAIKEQALTGAAAQKAIDSARLKARFLVGGADIARLYFQDNLTTSAVAGTALETAVAMIPVGPVAGIPKAMAMTLARQVNALFQLGESLARSRRTSATMDAAFVNINNKRTTEGAVSVMEELDPEIFAGLESASNGANGVPDVIVKAKEKTVYPE